MAGEVAGKICEAAVYLALRLSGETGRRIHWGKRPQGMSITTDFMTGIDPDAPESVILVTHSISAMQSHKKFWRNIGELIEVKTFLPTTPCIINVIFGSAEMKKLTIILSSVMDLSLKVRDFDRSNLLQGELQQLGKQAKGLSKEDVVELLENELGRNSKTVLQAIGNRIRDCYRQAQVSHPSLWKLVRSRKFKEALSGETRHLKRGAAKLLIFTSSEREALYEAAKRNQVLKKPVPLAKRLGFLGSIGSSRVTDDDIVGFAQRWTLEDLGYIEQQAPMADFEAIAISPLRGVVNLLAYLSYVEANYSTLSKSNGMLSALVACHKDPLSLCNLPSPVGNVWLADYMMAVAKAHRGGHNEFGHSQLAEAAGIKEGISASGYRIFADWINRKPKGVLPDATIDGVAKALAVELSSIGRLELKPLLPEIEDSFVRTYLNIKLLTYENFDPVRYLIERQLAIDGIPFDLVKRHSSVYAEIAGTDGASSDILRAGKSTLIYWNSATDSGRDHKRKELEGRIVGLRWQKLPTGFRPRAAAATTILVVDGKWLQSDFTALQKAGWDHILYCDDLGGMGSLIDK
jgi:hypothetical protein